MQRFDNLVWIRRNDREGQHLPSPKCLSSVRTTAAWPRRIGANIRHVRIDRRTWGSSRVFVAEKPRPVLGQVIQKTLNDRHIDPLFTDVFRYSRSVPGRLYGTLQVGLCGCSTTPSPFGSRHLQRPGLTVVHRGNS